MSLFVCDRCGCVDNTALGRYWSKDMDIWGEDNRGLALCSKCAPDVFEDGSPVNRPHDIVKFGEWHNKFPKRKWDGKTEVINR